MFEFEVNKLFDNFNTYDPIKLCYKFNIVCMGLPNQDLKVISLKIEDIHHIFYNDKLSEIDMNVCIAYYLCKIIFHNDSYLCDDEVSLGLVRLG